MKCANHGCGAVAEPSGVMKKPVEDGSSPGTVGVATKCDTRTTNSPPLRRWRLGVITSSSPSRAKRAAWPLTLTAPTAPPAKSRLNRLRSWVARATIVTVPSSGWDGALVA
jgi:hypothetical protein